MKKAGLLLIVFFGVALMGCEKSEWLNDGDYFFLEAVSKVLGYE